MKIENISEYEILINSLQDQLPLWPDDEITQMWLHAIDEVRQEANIEEGIEGEPVSNTRHLAS